MRATSIVVLFNFLASGAMSMPAQADNAGALAIEARALGGATENRLDTRMLRTGSGSAAAANSPPGSPKGTKTCFISNRPAQGYLDYTDFVAQSQKFCDQLHGRSAPKDYSTEVRCINVPRDVKNEGQVVAQLRGGHVMNLAYWCRDE
ncbi:hypothetical protein MCOR25_006762 [Pyricularia grisea]|nr:hypothetical protein MCOR25_006762 [Pyricularia grisea]